MRTPPWTQQLENREPDKNKEEYVFLSNSFPPNSIPFINRLKEILDEAWTNSLQTLSRDTDEKQWKARALLWIINSQMYGQMGVIDLTDEWNKLNNAYNAGKF